MISYVYWKDEVSSIKLTCINIATLAGTLLGMVLFGFLADKNGRKKMYGVELVLLITATIGVVMSSQGENGSMNVYGWLIWWRICVGIGVGADYPLSAVISLVVRLWVFFFISDGLFEYGQDHRTSACGSNGCGRVLLPSVELAWIDDRL